MEKKIFIVSDTILEARYFREVLKHLEPKVLVNYSTIGDAVRTLLRLSPLPDLVLFYIHPPIQKILDIVNKLKTDQKVSMFILSKDKHGIWVITDLEDYNKNFVIPDQPSFIRAAMRRLLTSS